MTKITIPPAARAAGANVLTEYGITAATDADLARAAFEAMVGAWPGMEEVDWYHADKSIILPLTENPDAEAR